MASGHLKIKKGLILYLYWPLGITLLRECISRFLKYSQIVFQLPYSMAYANITLCYLFHPWLVGRNCVTRWVLGGLHGTLPKAIFGRSDYAFFEFLTRKAS